MNSGEREAPLILTLSLDEPSAAYFESLRRLYFPKQRNVVPAHITLFHQLPGSDLPAIQGQIERVCAEVETFPLDVTDVRSLGRGVAFVMKPDRLLQVHEELAALWSSWLIPQDRGRLRPHVTVQNKVTPDEARALLAKLEQQFRPFTVQADSLTLWHYRNGPWEHAFTVPFRR